MASWTEYFNDDNIPYYVDSVTQESSWTKPQAMIDYEAEQAAAAAAAAEAAQPKLTAFQKAKLEAQARESAAEAEAFENKMSNMMMQAKKEAGAKGREAGIQRLARKEQEKICQGLEEQLLAYRRVLGNQAGAEVAFSADLDKKQAQLQAEVDRLSSLASGMAVDARLLATGYDSNTAKMQRQAKVQAQGSLKTMAHASEALAQAEKRRQTAEERAKLFAKYAAQAKAEIQRQLEILAGGRYKAEVELQELLAEQTELAALGQELSAEKLARIKALRAELATFQTQEDELQQKLSDLAAQYGIEAADESKAVDPAEIARQLAAVRAEKAEVEAQIATLKAEAEKGPLSAEKAQLLKTLSGRLAELQTCEQRLLAGKALDEKQLLELEARLLSNAEKELNEALTISQGADAEAVRTQLAAVEQGRRDISITLGAMQEAANSQGDVLAQMAMMKAEAQAAAEKAELQARLRQLEEEKVRLQTSSVQDEKAAAREAALHKQLADMQTQMQQSAQNNANQMAAMEAERRLQEQRRTFEAQIAAMQGKSSQEQELQRQLDLVARQAKEQAERHSAELAAAQSEQAQKSKDKETERRLEIMQEQMRKEKEDAERRLREMHDQQRDSAARAQNDAFQMQLRAMQEARDREDRERRDREARDKEERYRMEMMDMQRRLQEKNQQPTGPSAEVLQMKEALQQMQFEKRLDELRAEFKEKIKGLEAEKEAWGQARVGMEKQLNELKESVSEKAAAEEELKKQLDQLYEQLKQGKATTLAQLQKMQEANKEAVEKARQEAEAKARAEATEEARARAEKELKAKTEAEAAEKVAKANAARLSAEEKAKQAQLAAAQQAAKLKAEAEARARAEAAARKKAKTEEQQKAYDQSCKEERERLMALAKAAQEEADRAARAAEEEKKRIEQEAQAAADRRLYEENQFDRIRDPDRAVNQCEWGLRTAKRLGKLFSALKEDTQAFSLAWAKTVGYERQKLNKNDGMIVSGKAVMDLINSLNNVGAETANFSKQVAALCGDPLFALFERGTPIAKATRENAKRELKALSKAMKAHGASHNAAAKEFANLQKLKEAYFAARDDEVATKGHAGPKAEKAYKQMDKQRKKTQESCMKYQDDVAHAQAAHDNYRKMILNIQNMEVERMEQLVIGFSSFQMLLRNWAQQITIAANTCQRSIETMHPRRDIYNFVLTSTDNGQNALERAVKYGFPYMPEQLTQQVYDKPSQVFENTFQTIMDYQKEVFPIGSENAIPMIITALTQSVDELGGLKTPGIFRESGQRILDSGEYPELEALQNQIIVHNNYVVESKNPHVPASCLTKWFAAVPEPVIPVTEFAPCIALIENEPADESALVPKIVERMDKLPPLNRSILVALLIFFQKIVDEEPFNHMDRRNTATTFAPFIIRFSPLLSQDQALKEKAQMTRFLELLIHHQAQIFPETAQFLGQKRMQQEADDEYTRLMEAARAKAENALAAARAAAAPIIMEVPGAVPDDEEKPPLPATAPGAEGSADEEKKAKPPMPGGKPPMPAGGPPTAPGGPPGSPKTAAKPPLPSGDGPGSPRTKPPMPAGEAPSKPPMPAGEPGGAKPNLERRKSATPAAKPPMPDEQPRRKSVHAGDAEKPASPGGKPPMPAGKPPMPAGKPPMPDGKPPMPAGKPPMPEGKPPMPEGKPPMPAGKPPMPGGKPPMPAGKPPMPAGPPPS